MINSSATLLNNVRTSIPIVVDSYTVAGKGRFKIIKIGLSSK